MKNFDIISTADAPLSVGPYSQATKFGELIFVAGQGAFDPASGKLVTGDIREQTRQTLKNIGAILLAADSGLDCVLKATIFLHEWQYFDGMNEVFGEVFGDRPPARSTVCGQRWPEGSLVAIEAVAHVR